MLSTPAARALLWLLCRLRGVQKEGKPETNGRTPFFLPCSLSIHPSSGSAALHCSTCTSPSPLPLLSINVASDHRNCHPLGALELMELT